MALNWDDRLKVGNELIDAQHKELIDNFNLFVASCKSNKGKETLAGTIEFLENYVVKHFAVEEELMRKHAYPEMVDHLALHNEFNKKFEEMKLEFTSIGSSISLIIEMNEFLLRWFITHIKGVDSKLGAFISKK